MKVLYFSPRECWPPETGARLRDYHLARHIARRASLTYFSLRDPRDPPPRLPDDCEFARSVAVPKPRGYTPAKLVRGLLGPVPVTVLNYTCSRVAAELARVLDQGCFDAVQIEGVHLVEYLPVLRRARSRPAIVADWHNIESELMRRYGEKSGSYLRKLTARRTACLLERAEARLARGCDVHVVTSERERKALLARFPEAAVRVVRNGVDVEAFSSGEANRAGDSCDPPNLLFVGSMDYHANIDAVTWFIREVWPELRRGDDRLRFTIAGRNPGPEIRALAGGGVVVTGTVPDVRPLYQAATVVVVPVRIGGGTRLKILEAMAAGVPVVSTSAGAEGLEVAGGENILLADTPQQMMECLRALLASPALRRTLAENGRQLVSRCYDWSRQGAVLFEILQKAAAGRRAR